MYAYTYIYIMSEVGYAGIAMFVYTYIYHVRSGGARKERIVRDGNRVHAKKRKKE